MNLNKTSTAALVIIACYIITTIALFYTTITFTDKDGNTYVAKRNLFKKT